LLQSGNLGEIERIPATSRNNAIKSLIVLAKFTGVAEQFREGLKRYGIKLSRPDALAAFTRIYTNRNSDLGEWLDKVGKVLYPEELLFLRFLRATGLRLSEGIAAFNLIIEYAEQGKLDAYLSSTGVLEHFRFKKQFIRGTKNAYISIVPESLVCEIAKSKSVTYNAILKKLQRRGLNCRINELRDYYGTFMLRHGLVREEVDLLCGRIPPSIFVRHYFSPAISELRNRVLKALEEIET